MEAKTLRGVARGIVCYIPGDSLVYRLSPVTKLLVFAFMTIAAAISYLQNIRVLFVVFLISVGLFFVAKLPSVWVRVVTVVFGLQVMGTVVTNTFFPPGFAPPLGGTVILQVWWFVLKDIAVSRILFVAFLLFSMAYTSMFLVGTTTQRDMTLGLRSLRFPYTVCLLLTLIFRSAGLFLTDYVTVREAQSSRALDFSEGSAIERLKKYLGVGIPLIVVSTKRATSLSNAMDSRGFGASNVRKTQYHVLKFNWIDYAVIFAFASLVVVSILFRVIA